MLEPITISGAALAIAHFVAEHTTGHIVGGEAHHFYRHFLERWRESPIDPKTGLPHNHDLESAGAEALRAALFVLVMELAGRTEPKKPWLTNWAATLSDGSILSKELFPDTQDSNRRWLDGLRKIISGDRVKFLHRTLKLDEKDQRQCFAEGNVCQALGPAFADSVLEWARLELAGWAEHPDFENLVREGWELPGILNRVTLPQAYCLFFREHLKTNDKVFHIVVADTLNEVRSHLRSFGDDVTSEIEAVRDKLDALASNNFASLKINWPEFQQWLEPQLGEIKTLLDHAIIELTRLTGKQDELLVAVFTLNTDVRCGNAAAGAQIEQLRNWLLARFERLQDEVAKRVTDELKPLFRQEITSSKAVDRMPAGGTHAEAPKICYMRALLAQFDYIVLPVFIAGMSRIPLRSLFLHPPLRIRNRPSNFDSHEASVLQQSHEESVETRTWRIEERIAQSSAVLIVGGAGTGKSTLLASLVCEAARSAIDFDGLQPETHWPVVLVCGELPEFPPVFNLKDIITAQLQQWPLPNVNVDELAEMAFKDLLNGRATLYVDGIDEMVSPDSRERLCRLLTQLSTMTQCRVVATARPENLAGLTKNLTCFEMLDIIGLEESEISTYVDKWAALRPSCNREHIKWRLANDHALIRLCKTAHFLALVVQAFTVDEALQTQDLRLFQQLVVMMIDSQLRGTKGRLPLELNEVNPHLEVLSFHMQQLGMVRITEPAAVACFDEVRRLEQCEEVLTRRASQQLLNEILTCLGILCYAGKAKDARGMQRKTIKFLHQSWQYYYAAMAVVHGRAGQGATALERIQSLLLKSVESSPESHERREAAPWQDIFLMAIDGIANEFGPGESEKAICALISEGNISSGELRTRCVMAIKCLASDLIISRNTARLVIKLALRTILKSPPGEEVSANLRLLAESRWKRVLRSTIFDEYARGENRLRKAFGLLFLSSYATGAQNRQMNEMEGAKKRLLALRDRGIADRRLLYSLLQLVESCYQKATNKSRSGEETPPHIRTLLFDCLGKGDASVNATALWALVWLSEARGDESSNWLSDEEGSRVLALLQNPEMQDDLIWEFGAELLTSRAGVRRYAPNQDWIYDLAIIADGRREQKTCILPSPQLKDAGLISLFLPKLVNGMSAPAVKKIALALARLGWSGEELVTPLVDVLKSPDLDVTMRDEALLWLARSGLKQASEALVSPARNGRTEEHYDLSARAMFGIIALGHRDVILAELAKGTDAAGGYCNEFALAAMGLADPRGSETVFAWCSHQDLVVSNACRTAVQVAADWGDEGSALALKTAATGWKDNNLTAGKRVIAEKTICLLLVRGEDPSGRPMFAYVKVSMDKLPAFMAAQKNGTFYPEDFGIVIESGAGEPTPEVRQKMEREYGFNHEAR